MPSVLAFDYHGTIARDGHLHESVLAALQAARMEGFALVLVTGRTFVDLLRECPNALAVFDRVVCENGAVLARAGMSPRPLAEPVEASLERALEKKGVDTVRGQVILWTEARHEAVVTQVAAKLKCEVRLARNRAGLMIAPLEVSKASGLSHALSSLGVSFGEAIAFGDAENDLEMLGCCALGVAVADAVDELKAAADVVLPISGPEGVADFVIGLVQAARAQRLPNEDPEGDDGALV